jgi:hypothetical protein
MVWVVVALNKIEEGPLPRIEQTLLPLVANVPAEHGVQEFWKGRE